MVHVWVDPFARSAVVHRLLHDIHRGDAGACVIVLALTTCCIHAECDFHCLDSANLATVVKVSRPMRHQHAQVHQRGSHKGIPSCQLHMSSEDQTHMGLHVDCIHAW